MNQISIEIERHLNLRLGENSKKVNYSLSISDMKDCLHSCINIIRPKDYFIHSVRGDYNNFYYEVNRNIFKTDVLSGLERRVVPFANYLLRVGGKKQVLVNMNDAEGYDYNSLLPADLNYQTIIQFSRRIQQRDSVTLFPLAKKFMGLGSPNIPNSKDIIPFKSKIPTIVWRGGPSGCYISDDNRKMSARNLAFHPNPEDEFHKFQRLNLIPKLAKYQDLNIGYVETANKNYSEINALLKDRFPFAFKNSMDIDQQRKYKYILAIDGNDYPSNLFWALMSNSVVFKTTSEWETALSVGLEPWKHFVPVDPDAESVLSMINYMNEREAECDYIIKNAHEYMSFCMNEKYRKFLDKLTIDKYMEHLVDISGVTDDVCFFSSNGLM